MNIWRVQRVPMAQFKGWQLVGGGGGGVSSEIFRPFSSLPPILPSSKGASEFAKGCAEHIYVTISADSRIQYTNPDSTTGNRANGHRSATAHRRRWQSPSHTLLSPLDNHDDNLNTNYAHPLVRLPRLCSPTLNLRLELDASEV